jgi:hypothetical protein
MQATHCAFFSVLLSVFRVFEMSHGSSWSTGCDATLKRTSDNWKPGFRASRQTEQPLEYKNFSQKQLLQSTGFLVKDACGVFSLPRSVRMGSCGDRAIGAEGGVLQGGALART